MKALGKVCKDAFFSLIHFTELRKIGRNGMTVPGYNSISKSVCVSEGGGRGGGRQHSTPSQTKLSSNSAIPPTQEHYLV